MRGRFFQIKEVLSRRLYFFLFIFFSLFYIGIYYGIIRFFFYGLQTFLVTYKPSYVYPAIFLNLIVALLVGINISLLVFWVKEIRSVDSGGSVAGFFGIFAAALANGCPGCIAGLFPLFLSIFRPKQKVKTHPSLRINMLKFKP